MATRTELDGMTLEEQEAFAFAEAARWKAIGKRLQAARRFRTQAELDADVVAAKDEGFSARAIEGGR